MIAYNMPRPGKKLPPPILAGGSNGLLREMFDANEENQKQFLDGYLDHDVKLDLWWMDAGWYPCQKGWYDGVGNWEMDRQRFPNGLRAVTDYAHRRGVNALLWFEPERVAPGTWLDENKKHWLLGPDGRQKLFSLGNPEARQWMVERIEKIMKAEGIDIYRQDFNIRPLEYWKENDAPDRQGITEIKHCMGYLAFWDELRRRIPNLLIDACASGGRRLDLETLRRALPLHKSDMNYFDLTAKQTQFYGLSLWHPYFATCAMPLEKVDTYGVRTCFALLLGVDYDIRRDDVDFALLRKLTAEWREIAPNYYGDFWPLTQWSYALDTWIAWQFDRPDEGQGVIQIFRRQESPYETARFKLRGLDPAATYRLKDFDKEGTTEFRGRDLMEKGLLVTMEKAPQAAVITYEKT
jgi:alpha-galactosidase